LKNDSFLLFNKRNFFVHYFSLFVFALLIILKISSPTLAIAAEATLQWNPSPGATGYKLHYGVESHSYDDVIDVGYNLQHTVPYLDDNQLYYFAVSAYNDDAESEYSNEVFYNTGQNNPSILWEIIGTWSSGIWYWDMAASQWTQMTVFATTGDIAAGDFTGDGKADVASIWDSGLWYQDGTTLAWTRVPGSAPDKLTAGDVTGDGRFEIIGTWNSGIWYWDVAESSWTQMTSEYTDGDIAAGDFTGDGKADVASIWDDGLWYQDGATLAWTKLPGSALNSLTTGDVTGDGQAELIGASNRGIWYWDLAASNWTQMTADTPDGDIAAGDFTGDGKVDVASIWSSGLWYQDGATLGWTKVSDSAPNSVTAGDVTGQ
jgi:hypothetical protein